ncbi:MAG: ABC transporter ATP-binding protein [Anaerolineales bacterium]
MNEIPDGVALDRLIQLVGISKRYPQGDDVRVVLDQASAVIREGEFVAIRGRSGSGKTTLLNLIAGLDVPSGGQILMDGVDLASLSDRQRTLFRRRNIGIVFQFFNLIPTLTVIENVLLPAELAGGAARSVKEEAEELLDQVGLAGREADAPDQLSGGEQQRVAIARALLQAPRLVLADEPTGNLDRATGEQVLDLLVGLTKQKGKTLVVVTHSRAIAAIADRVLTIEGGLLRDSSGLDDAI